MNFLKRVVKAISHRNKRETLNYLQAMPAEQLIDSGFSPTLIREGVSAWPWREDNQTEMLSEIEYRLAEEQRCVTELQSYSNSELADLGLYRGSIREAVRYGRPGIDNDRSQKAA